MALPHFEVATFSSQLLWLVITAGITYGFNKLIFLPLIKLSLSKRQKMLDDYLEEANRMNEHINNLSTDIELLIKRGQIESKTIIEQAIAQSQAILFDHAKKNNELLLKRITEYDQYIEKSKAVLQESADSVVKDVKDKISYFILRQNI